MKFLTSNNLDLLVEDISISLSKNIGIYLIAIDGKSGTGKTTLANNLARLLHDNNKSTTIIYSDDFYNEHPDEYWLSLPIRERYNKCIDYQRMMNLALQPLLDGETSRWESYGHRQIQAPPAQVIIIEGIYSTRPELYGRYNLTIKCEVDENTRNRRLAQREDPALLDNWKKIWEEVEQYYSLNICSNETFDYIISPEIKEH